MKQLLFTLFILASHSTFSQILTEDYIQEWKSFYPGNALQMGLHESVFHFEDRSETEINQWLNYNQMILQKIENSEPSEIPADKINTRLLRSQIMTELQKWEKDPPHQTSLRFYTQLFNQALNKFSRVKFLTWDDQHLLQLEAYESINSNCIHLIRNLKSIKDQDPDQSIDQLRSILNIMNRHKSQVEHKMALSKNDEEVLLKTEQALASLEKAQSHVESLPRESQTPVLGPEEYARRLTIYTDSDLSPKQMESMALHEIKVTRQLMKEVAGKYLKARYPEKSLPEKEDDIIKMALDDMEKDVVTSAVNISLFGRNLLKMPLNSLNNRISPPYLNIRP